MTQTMIGTCERCAMPVRIAGAGNRDAEMLRYAQQLKGYCANCAVHDWLRNTYPVNLQLAEAGPKILLHDEIRALFAEIMRAGNADMRPEEINWNLIVENWELPFAKKVKPGLRNPCGQEELDEVASGKRKAFGNYRRESLGLAEFAANSTIRSFEELNDLEAGLGDRLRDALGEQRLQNEPGPPVQKMLFPEDAGEGHDDPDAD